MLSSLNTALFLLLLCFALTDSQRNECIYSEYAENSSDIVYKCREGCSGTAPNCVPLCVGGCPENSFCSKPNVCQCNAAYLANETNAALVPSLVSCKSACEQGCPAHNVCVGYNTCRCAEGYVADDAQLTATASVKSCKLRSQGLMILLYVLIICAVVLVALAGLTYIVMRIKRNREDVPPQVKECSWHTSNASYMPEFRP